MTDTSLGMLRGLQERGDSRSWRLLVTEYEPFLRSCLTRFNAPVGEVDDVVQEVLVVVHNRVADFQHNGNPGAFRRWLQRIAANCLKECWRSERLRPSPPGGSQFQSLLHELEGPVCDLTERLEREHRRHLLAGLMKRVRKDFGAQTWNAFDLLTLKQLSTEQVAERLAMSPAAVYAAKSRVMTRLRRLAQEVCLDQ